MRADPISNAVIGASIDVHRALGPGLLESVHEECLCYELKERGLSFARQAQVPVHYRDAVLDAAYRIDLIVEDTVLVELKAIDLLLPVHLAQLRTYLRVTGFPIGLLINFNVAVLRDGLRRLNSHDH